VETGIVGVLPPIAAPRKRPHGPVTAKGLRKKSVASILGTVG